MLGRTCQIGTMRFGRAKESKRKNSALQPTQRAREKKGENGVDVLRDNFVNFKATDSGFLMHIARYLVQTYM